MSTLVLSPSWDRWIACICAMVLDFGFWYEGLEGVSVHQFDS